MTTTVHGDEPPRRFLDAMANSDQSVIAQNRSFVSSESLRNALALRRFIDHAGELRKESVGLVKRTRIPSDRVEQPPERRPGFPVHRMRMRRCDHVGPCGVYLRVDGKGRCINRIISFHDFAAMIYQNQVGRSNLAEVHPEWVHPEVVESFRIACGDMPGHSFIESQTRKKTECGGQHAFAMQAFFGCGGKYRRPQNVPYISGGSAHLDLPAQRISCLAPLLPIISHSPPL